MESFEKRPDFVLLKNFDSHPMVENVSSIITNYPAAVVMTGETEGAPSGRVSGDIAWTSTRSFLDLDRDGIRDNEEPAGQFSVIAVRELSENGRMVVIADPGIFVNDMIGRANNRQFAISLFEWATGGGSKPIIFDLTHSGYAPAGWVEVAPYGSSVLPMLAVLFFAVSLVAMGIAVGRKIGIARPRKVGGRLSRDMGKYSKEMDSVVKTNLNEPLLVYYEQFLERCGRTFKSKELDEEKLLRKIKAEHPKYYQQLRRIINVCGQVRVGARDIRSPAALRRMIEKMSKFEKELGAKV